MASACPSTSTTALRFHFYVHLSPNSYKAKIDLLPDPELSPLPIYPLLPASTKSSSYSHAPLCFTLSFLFLPLIHLIEAKKKQRRFERQNLKKRLQSAKEEKETEEDYNEVPCLDAQLGVAAYSAYEVGFQTLKPHSVGTHRTVTTPATWGGIMVVDLPRDEASVDRAHKLGDVIRLSINAIAQQNLAVNQLLGDYLAAPPPPLDRRMGRRDMRGSWAISSGG
ncbi:hypothetical protein DFH27DRAFT_598153 [Peziza echinospora]|nr:hypothetical protein DFH27DRAFT_598153 [Peziza echinospora]